MTTVPREAHLPALDGLRGLAVAGVVAFHGAWPWARGGFLGVSLFFTLSGFLITTLLIDEWRRGGTICDKARLNRSASFIFLPLLSLRLL